MCLGPILSLFILSEIEWSMWIYVCLFFLIFQWIMCLSYVHMWKNNKKLLSSPVFICHILPHWAPILPLVWVRHLSAIIDPTIELQCSGGVDPRTLFFILQLVHPVSSHLGFPQGTIMSDEWVDNVWQRNLSIFCWILYYHHHSSVSAQDVFFAWLMFYECNDMLTLALSSQTVVLLYIKSERCFQAHTELYVLTCRSLKAMDRVANTGQEPLSQIHKITNGNFLHF